MIELPEEVKQALFKGYFFCEENLNELERLEEESEKPNNIWRVVKQVRKDYEFLENICKKYNVI